MNRPFHGKSAHGTLLWMISGLLLILSSKVSAASCSNIFSNGAQSHSASGYLEMDWRSQITGGGTALKVPSIDDDSGWASCQTGACTATGTYNSAINYSVPASSGANGAISVGYRGNVSKSAGQYTSVNIGQEGTLRFTTNNGQYYMNGVTSNYRSVLNLSPGDYYINGNLVIGQETTINISGNAPARLFVNGSVSFDFKAISSNTNPANLLIYAKNSVELDNEVDLKAFIYSQTGGITMNFRSKITGGVSAAGRIFLDNEASLTYSNSAATADFGSLCNGSVPSINNFSLDTGGSTASTCTPQNITITVRDSNNAKLTTYTGTISLTTSTGRGTWAKTTTPANANGTLSLGNDNGQATYTFTAEDAGDIVLTLSNQRAQSLTITASDSGAGISATSSAVTFADNAFVIASANTSWGEDVVGMRDHPFTATMMRRDANGACGAATSYNVPNLRMWITRHGNDPGGAAPSAVVRASVVSLPNTQPAFNNVTLSFTDGVADFSLQTTDVGKYAINIADNSNSFASQVISGATGNLVVRPFGIHIAVSDNPAAADASGEEFVAAGEAFTVTVKAVGWQEDDDSNQDGIPDYHDDQNPGNNKNLADNPSLDRFGRETPQEGITLSSRLVLPSDGSESELSGGSLTTFNVGTGSSPNISFGEVGIIEIGAQITDSDYLGSPGSSKIMGKSGYVGRFYPNHFSLSDTATQPSCNAVLPYSYLEEPFSLTAEMTPYNAAGIPVQNYQGDFNKFDTTAFADMLSAIDEGTSSLLTDRIAVTSDSSALDWVDGVLTATPTIKIIRDAAPDGPFPQVRVGFAPVDTDGVSLDASDLNLDTNGDGTPDAARLGTTTMGLRFGRLRLDDSYGPETANLPVIFRTEYWDGNEWKQNRDDSCTQIALTEIAYPDGPISVSANRSPAVGGGATTGEYANLSATSVNFADGDAGHYFTAPGSGNIGTVAVQVDLTDYSWLRFDWNNDGDFSDSSLPTSNFSFGNYRGHDRMLYWIEAAGY